MRNLNSFTSQVYCSEWKDNNGKVSNLILPRENTFTTAFMPGMLNGINILKGQANAVITDSVKNTVTTISQPFVAIPYYAWANRGKGEMSVWIPERVKEIEILSR